MRSNRFALCMLLGCLLLVASCGKEKAVPTSGPVGHVVVVKGEVHAQRAEQEARLVQIDDTVFADDTIVTGEAANIQILITHNGGVWELGENSSRRIDKGIGFRAKTKGAAPLDRKEALETAAAGRNTTREAGETVGTVMADEKRPLKLEESPKGQGRQEAGPAANPTPGNSAQPSPPTPSDKPPTPSSKPPGKPLSEMTSQSEMPKRPKRDRSIRSKGGGAKRDSKSADNGEVPKADDVLQATPPTEAKPKYSAAASEQRAYLRALIRKCQKTHPGKGTLSYALSATGALKASASDASLAPLVRCLREAVRAKAPPSNEAVSGSLRLP